MDVEFYECVSILTCQNICFASWRGSIEEWVLVICTMYVASRPWSIEQRCWCNVFPIWHIIIDFASEENEKMFTITGSPSPAQCCNLQATTLPKCFITMQKIRAADILYELSCYTFGDSYTDCKPILCWYHLYLIHFCWLWTTSELNGSIIVYGMKVLPLTLMFWRQSCKLWRVSLQKELKWRHFRDWGIHFWTKMLFRFTFETKT